MSLEEAQPITPFDHDPEREPCGLFSRIRARWECLMGRHDMRFVGHDITINGHQTFERWACARCPHSDWRNYQDCEEEK